MTTYRLTIRQDHFQALKGHLIQPSGFEQAAYVLCREANVKKDPWEHETHRRFLTREVRPVPDEDLIRSTATSVTWRTQSFVSALKFAADNGMTVAIIHSHPSGANQFSAQDDRNEPDLVQLAINRNGPGTNILSLILTEGGVLTGRIWLAPKRGECAPLKLISVVGDRFNFHYPSRSAYTSPKAFNRQALAFGHALNKDLATLRVGVVGCGGTGSATAMLLARLGVGKIVLIDKDIVDYTNLNRLHGSCNSDADSENRKAQVVAQSIKKMGLGTRVMPIVAWVNDADCREALLSCDIIFGCTDDNTGRILLNRLAYYYLIPVIDMGLAIKVKKGGQGEIEALDGRVSVLQPKNACLSCCRVINVEKARAETLQRTDPAEYQRQKNEAYVIGEGDPSPAVVTFTTELATMAVNEMIHRLQGFRGSNGQSDCRIRKFHLDTEDRHPGHKPQKGCQICDQESIWGYGDSEPFLGIVS